MHELELYLLEISVNTWCEFLEKNGYNNFSNIIKKSFQSSINSFGGSPKVRYEGLLKFQDNFNGGMGSINDLLIDDALLRKVVETERDLLIKKYYSILYPRR